jgi:hypothetical protein
VSLCEVPDFVYPLYADIYYATISQGPYGQISKAWTFDRTIVCNASPVGGASKEKLEPAEFLKYKDNLVSRSKKDLRFMSDGKEMDMTNIIITNIRDRNDLLIFKESAGPRKNQGTLYEIAMLEPLYGPFQYIEYYKMLWRRTESQVLNSVTS